MYVKPPPSSPACASLHSRCTVNASQHAGLSNHRSCRLPSWLVMCRRSTEPQNVAPRTNLNHGTLLLRRLSHAAPQLPTPPLCFNLSHGLVFTTVRSPSNLVTSSPSGGPGLVSCSLPPLFANGVALRRWSSCRRCARRPSTAWDQKSGNFKKGEQRLGSMLREFLLQAVAPVPGWRQRLVRTGCCLQCIRCSCTVVVVISYSSLPSPVHYFNQPCLTPLSCALQPLGLRGRQPLAS